ncbi:hypothetical protein HNY73_008481 [Argiope bruennichi]|uniref:Uncharacterized protein n=1 Tax=Argiope bruennichi TaxID=94029 RepID=A0A8T0FBK8_ARGBR|nr:hypothetical protein HNY73_008481 [Argiope bruennichi]
MRDPSLHHPLIINPLPPGYPPIITDPSTRFSTNSTIFHFSLSAHATTHLHSRRGWGIPAFFSKTSNHPLPCNNIVTQRVSPSMVPLFYSTPPRLPQDYIKKPPSYAHLRHPPKPPPSTPRFPTNPSLASVLKLLYATHPFFPKQQPYTHTSYQYLTSSRRRPLHYAPPSLS